ncbi:hypothetical protein FRB94_000079 [Tulasnella sp. JGI-2019a]|nr:hypothetical protein FRB94_000079 [Tulasnella sp. JGI-2019a]
MPVTTAADINIAYDDNNYISTSDNLSTFASLSLASDSSSPQVSAACIRLLESTYVPALAALPGTTSFGAVLSAPASDGQTVSIFDLTTTSCIKSFVEHTDVITALGNIEKLGGNYAQSLLLSSSKDGTVKVWDARVPSAASSLTVHAAKQAPLLSLDICQSDGCLLAAGSELVGDEAHIMFWDVRWPEKILHIHSSTHSDNITCVHFQPPAKRSGEILLSASSDGLICTTDARQSDEDEAVLQVGNWQKSVSHCGWMGGDGNGGVWSASDMETLTLWNEELEVAFDYGDMRQPKIPGTWETNYIIDGEWLSSGDSSLYDSDALGIWLGNNSGDFALCTPGEVDHSLRLQRMFLGGAKGHTGIVRSVLYDKKNGCIVSGGEDSTIHIWPVKDDGAADPVDEDGDAEMMRASPPSKSPSSPIRKRKHEDPEVVNKKGRRGF